MPVPWPRVIGEDELSDTDKQYLAFGQVFEQQFL